MEEASLMENTTQILTEYFEEFPTTAVVIFESFLVLWICIGNSLVIAAYRKYERLQTVANFFVIHLAIADLCVGASIIYMIVLTLFIPIELAQSSIPLCILSHTLLTLPALMSLLLLLLITIDRYVAIFYPLKYPNIMTKWRMQVLVASLWIGLFIYIGISITESIVFHSNTGQLNICQGDDGNIETRIMGYTYLPLFLVVVIIIVALYIRILWTVRKKLDQHDNNDTTNLQKNVKLVKTATLVIGLFIMCWLPLVVLASGYTMNFFSAEQKQNMFMAYMVFNHLAFMNSGMNFIVYPIRSKDFRAGLKTVLCCKGRYPMVTPSKVSPTMRD